MTPLLATFRHTTLPPSAEHFRSEVREFLASSQPELSPDRKARSWMGYDADFSRRLARRGWVGVTLPTRYGGANLHVFQRFVLIEELLVCGAPVGAHWIADRQSGPMILRYGSEAQRERYLPAICKAEAFFGIGMSEPGAGSDLASVATRADKQPGGWKLRGRKLWTTHGHTADYLIVLARTSGTASDRHQGLSQFIVDLRLPGVHITPIDDLVGDRHFCEILFDDVLLSDESLIGAEGEGWAQVTAELAFERSGPERIYSSILLLNLWLEHLRHNQPTELDYATLGRLTTHLLALRQMSLAVTAQLAEGHSPAVAAALVKDLATSFEQSIPDLLTQALGQQIPAQPGPALYQTLMYLTYIAPSYSLRGGTREILRSMIARGLGLR